MTKVYGWPWLMVAKARSLPDKPWSYGFVARAGSKTFWAVRL